MARVNSVPVTVMVFTLDEEIHLPSCLASVAWTDDVIVVDSGSRDATVEIARRNGARVFEHPFEGFGKQRMWALENAAPKYDWVLILDADERVMPELAAELAAVVGRADDAVGAYRLKRRFHLWGRWLRHSSLYPTWVVRLVRRGRVEYINRGHAETQRVKGETRSLQHDLVDENLKGLDEWFQRQNRYSSREAEFEAAQDAMPLRLGALASGDPVARREALKRLVSRMPMRPLAYFLYSYAVRGGFLDGRDGFHFCLMKAQYQRMVVIKKHDLRRRMRP